MGIARGRVLINLHSSSRCILSGRLWMKRSSFLLDGNAVARSAPPATLSNLLKAPLRPIYRRGLHVLVYTLRWFRADPHRVIYIDPAVVTHTVSLQDYTLKHNDMWHFGTVAPGDWDLGGAPLQEYGLVFPILMKRVTEGLEFDEIPEFRENLKRIARGENVDGCFTENQYRRKWQHIQGLYLWIKENGYRSQKQLRSGRPFNEIRVQVGRTGQLLFEEGLHRLVIAQVLGLVSIPVIVTRRHANWAGRRFSVAREETRASSPHSPLSE